MELVRNGICPECLDQSNSRTRRLFKKGIKRECSQGHLTIYGNPEFIAYAKIEKKKRKKKVDSCPACGGRVVYYDKKHDELLCECGVVLSGPPHETHGRWVKYPMGTRFDYSDIDATYNPHDEVDYGTFTPEW